MKVTKELKTFITNCLQEKASKEEQAEFARQRELCERLNGEILKSEEFEAYAEAKAALNNLIVNVAKSNELKTFRGNSSAETVRRSYEKAHFIEPQSMPYRKIEPEIARIITRIEYGTDYSDLSSVLAEYGIEL